ncbi:MAG TPA: type II toxin-antitoxin system VapC family toxin [Longimicrobium sp.]
MILFLDASALVKLYLEESGSSAMRDMFEARRFSGRFYISDYVGLEVFVRLHKHKRSASRQGRRAFQHGLRQFETHRARNFNVLALERHLLLDAEVLATRFTDSGAGTLDLIHLASAFQVQRNVPDEKLVFVAADRKLRHVAQRAGFRTFDPEQERPEDLARISDNAWSTGG